MIRIEKLSKETGINVPEIISFISKAGLRVYESGGDSYITEEDSRILKSQIPELSREDASAKCADYLNSLKNQLAEKDRMIFKLLGIIEGFVPGHKKPEKPVEKPVNGSGMEKPALKQPGRPVKYPKVDLSVYENDFDPAELYTASETISKLKEHGVRLTEVRLRDLKSKKKIYAVKDNRVNMYYWPSLAYYYGLQDWEEKKPLIYEAERPAEQPDKKRIPDDEPVREGSKEIEFISIKEIIKRLSDFGILKSESTIRQLRSKPYIASKRVGNLKLFNWFDVLEFYQNLSRKRKK